MTTENNTSVKNSAAKRGSKFTESNKNRYFNSPVRAKSIKDALEQLKTYTLNTKNRLPSRQERNSMIYLGLPIEREQKS